MHIGDPPIYQPIPVSPPKEALLLMQLFTVLHACGLIAFAYLFFVKKDVGMDVIMNALVMGVATPFTFCLVTVPALWGCYRFKNDTF